MKIVICEGNATAILRKHHAADSLAAGDGCISTDITGSTIPGKCKDKKTYSESSITNHSQKKAFNLHRKT